MSLDDFCRLTCEELEAVLACHRDHTRDRSREKWNMMRLHAVMTMQPHCKDQLNAEKLLPFPWDSEDEEESPDTAGIESAEERRTRVEAQKAKLGW